MDKTLATLKDIHLPNPIGLWPLAWGWIGLTIISIILIGMMLAVYHANQPRRRLKRQALLLLENYHKQYKEGVNITTTAAKISELLRRVALSAFPRIDVAALVGEAWILFLNESGTKVDFNPVKSLLLEAPYQRNAQGDIDLLFSTAKTWIKRQTLLCSN